jgi:hypothetical protein
VTGEFAVCSLEESFIDKEKDAVFLELLENAY